MFWVSVQHKLGKAKQMQYAKYFRDGGRKVLKVMAENNIHSWKKVVTFCRVYHQLLVSGVSPRQSCVELLVSKWILPAFGFSVNFQTVFNLSEILNIGILGKMKFHRIWGFELLGIGENVTNHTKISHIESLITDFRGRLVSNVCYRP